MKTSSKITKVGIIGAGQMGSGIAHVCAQFGFDVLLYDIAEEIIDKSLIGIEKQAKRLHEKKRITKKHYQAISSNILKTTNLEDFGDCELIIEAATEEEKIKKSIFKTLLPIIHQNTILATNTSSISITRLAAETNRPHAFIGVHFMNPVPVMNLVEIIKGITTDDVTYQTIIDFISRLDKTAVTSQDFPAFIVNRILVPMLNEAMFVLYEGIGNVNDIDQAMKLGANHPMGPLELADFIGLDTCLSIMQVIFNGSGDSKYRPCPLLVNYVEAGWLGRKSGKGFYDYSQKVPAPS
ncbi:MAG: 3-hydroxybutyryl-CoA dehydrogenase [Rhodospirillaceae bacterium]|jgi:3-hydroxybutyryl-CoA dehydrogenase|nr:3-hydroxybutyryl-CoA dehydrogenase [Rhodospirillaceae bacterium]